MSNHVNDLLEDFNVTVDFSVGQINALLNTLAQLPFTQVAGFIYTIQNQAVPQIEQARKNLNAVKRTQKNETKGSVE